MKHVSTTTMITKLSGLLGTTDLTDWEVGFVVKLQAYVERGEVTRLSDKQVEALDSIYSKHFA